MELNAPLVEWADTRDLKSCAGRHAGSNPARGTIKEKKMLKVVDISAYQKALELSYLVGQIDAVIIKATEGTTYVNKHCDGWYQKAIKYGLKRGIYHFMTADSAEKQWKYFRQNCENYFYDKCGDKNSAAIPILDWEKDEISIASVNQWVNLCYAATGIWPWVYANPYRFNNAKSAGSRINANAGRWIAQYPGIASFSVAAKSKHQTCDGTVCAWQFTSSGKLSGYSGNLDLSIYYGDGESWDKYVMGDLASKSTAMTEDTTQTETSAKESAITVEDDTYKVTIERK